MNKVLVTGGAGFIGSHIVDAMVEEGNSVVVIDDLSSGSRDNLRAGVELLEWDVRSDQTREYIASEEFDFIIHAAAQISVRISMEKPRFDTEVNVVGLMNMLEALRNKRQPHFIMISTGGAIYGEQEQFPADENHPILPTSVYGLAKRVSELYLDLWRRQFKLPFTALRLSNVYGPRQNPHGEAGVVAIFSKKLIAGERPRINGSGEQTRDFVYVGDVAEAVRKVVAEKPAGIFNIGTGRETSVNQLYQIITRSLDMEVEPEYGPPAPGEQMRSCIDPSLALRTFGWQPTVSIDDGIKLTTDWFRQQS
ncbi:MAG: NAD-dependent epimerase/dehydratase family protein [Candidatus Dadabacteria bacterium]|nr:MAG: NAD-dependent epimerase/dehydratase family protein [Candidatus Dadabacteria bacterium]